MKPRDFLEVILERCPSYRAPLADCTLSQLRAGGDHELGRQRLSAMTEDELDTTIRNHFLCVCRKSGCET